MHASKIVCEIVQGRSAILLDDVEGVVGDYQNGFRAKRGTLDSIFSYKRISELLREQDMALHTAFIDFRKAFLHSTVSIGRFAFTY